MAGKSRSRNRASTDSGSGRGIHPTAWTWSNYYAQLPQSEEEKKQLERIAPNTSNRWVLEQSNGAGETHIVQKFSFFGPILLALLLCSLLFIYILSDKVIELQLYRLANYENICGEPAGTNLSGVEFVKKLAERENCLIQSKRRAFDLTTSLKTLREAFVDSE